jgi:hypothetical protein
MPGAIAEEAHLRPPRAGGPVRPASSARLNVREARRAAEPGDQRGYRTPAARTESKEASLNERSAAWRPPTRN